MFAAVTVLKDCIKASALLYINVLLDTIILVIKLALLVRLNVRYVRLLLEHVHLVQLDTL